MHANKTVVNGKYVYQENCYQKFAFQMQGPVVSVANLQCWKLKSYLLYIYDKIQAGFTETRLLTAFKKIIL